MVVGGLGTRCRRRNDRRSALQALLGLLARTFKALGDPTRLRLLSLIAASEGGEACICDLTEPVGLSQPTVSHHMRLLVDAGLATREQRERWAYYRVVPDALEGAARALQPDRAGPELGTHV